jgi:cyanophycinase-like exopeptidase
MTRLLTIMGSGETAPTMMKVHRDLIDRVGGLGTSAVVLDTPYGFQENAPELAQRAIEYFRQSVQRSIEVAGLQRLHGDIDTVAVEQGLSRVRQAQYLFAGPGSPTYSLRQWTGTPVASLITDKLQRGGAVTFASAAALTLGRVTVPVYEIYKAGADAYWLDGLDVLASIGLNVAVIPHYDNTEGGHHDTRFCYLGERRLAILEQVIPDGCHVLGVDEHTGLVLDLDADTATVVGNSNVTVRVKGTSTVYPTGTTIPIDAIRFPATAGSATARAVVIAESTDPTDAEPAGTSLAADIDRCSTAFDSALAAADAPGAVGATLDLEASMHAWSADTLQSDAADRARALLRSMIVRLGDAAVGGLRDPREPIAPYVELIMELRTAVRADKRYDLSDLIRDRLATEHVEVRDTPTGPEWLLQPSRATTSDDERGRP